MTLMETAQAKLNKHPADTAERKTLSGLIFPFFAPARDTSSIASSGVYTLTPITLTTVGFDIFEYARILASSINKSDDKLKAKVNMEKMGERVSTA